MADFGAFIASGDTMQGAAVHLYVIPVVMRQQTAGLGPLGVPGSPAFDLGVPAFLIPVYSLAAASPSGAPAAPNQARPGGANPIGLSGPPGGAGPVVGHDASPPATGSLNPTGLSAPPDGNGPAGGAEAPVRLDPVNPIGRSEAPDAAPPEAPARPGRRRRSQRSV